MCTKATNRKLGFLSRIFYQCPQDVKEAPYKELVRPILEYETCPILEYETCVWDPQGVVLQEEIDKFENRATRFVTIIYHFETGSMTGIQEKKLR